MFGNYWWPKKEKMINYTKKKNNNHANIYINKYIMLDENLFFFNLIVTIYVG